MGSVIAESAWEQCIQALPGFVKEVSPVWRDCWLASLESKGDSAGPAKPREETMDKADEGEDFDFDGVD